MHAPSMKASGDCNNSNLGNKEHFPAACYQHIVNRLCWLLRYFAGAFNNKRANWLIVADNFAY